MATKITNEIIEQINELYLVTKVKAQVARQLGISPATVSKYIIPNYIPVADRVITHCNVEVTEDVSEIFLLEKGKMGDMCVLSQKEREELVELQKEIII